MFVSENNLEYPIQTRSESTGTVLHSSISEAISLSRCDNSIWEISFDVYGEKVRLIKTIDGWMLEKLL